jgi:hypothetical protein
MRRNYGEQQMMTEVVLELFISVLGQYLNISKA